MHTEGNHIMPTPYTIHVFVPGGDPDGLRIINHMNWTGIGLVFPRAKWLEIKQRPEFTRTGIYILCGNVAQDEEDDFSSPTIYVGQADSVRSRINYHHQNKDFWDQGIVFVSSNESLNRAHVTWLEYALIRRASETKRCHLDNSNVPKEPTLTEAEEADTKIFLKETLKILPLVALHAFEPTKPIPTSGVESTEAQPESQLLGPDTVVVPAREGGFNKVFLGENCWRAIRISGGMLDKIKYIAAYQTKPKSAITHYAPVGRIESYGESGKYKLIFSEKATELKSPIKLGDNPAAAIQGPRYTTLTKLKAAKNLRDL